MSSKTIPFNVNSVGLAIVRDDKGGSRIYCQHHPSGDIVEYVADNTFSGPTGDGTYRIIASGSDVLMDTPIAAVSWNNFEEIHVFYISSDSAASHGNILSESHYTLASGVWVDSGPGCLTDEAYPVAITSPLYATYDAGMDAIAVGFFSTNAAQNALHQAVKIGDVWENDIYSLPSPHVGVSGKPILFDRSVGLAIVHDDKEKGNVYCQNSDGDILEYTTSNTFSGLTGNGKYRTIASGSDVLLGTPIAAVAWDNLKEIHLFYAFNKPKKGGDPLTQSTYTRASKKWGKPGPTTIPVAAGSPMYATYSEGKNAIAVGFFSPSPPPGGALTHDVKILGELKWNSYTYNYHSQGGS